MHLPPIDPTADALNHVHLKPPFVQIQGVLNSRALPLPTSQPWLFRSGDISRITPQGIEQLHALGIRTVFDFRSASDVEKFASPVAVINGVRVVQAPLLHDPHDEVKNDEGKSMGWYEDDKMLRTYVEFREDAVGAFMRSYSRVLEQGSQSIAQLLRCLAEREEGAGVLFHCSMGKDRSGVVSALVLSLAGVEDSVIVNDYALTTQGLEPFADEFLKRFSDDRSFQQETEGAMNVFSSRSETMQAFLPVIREKFGGAEAYARDVAGLSQAEVEAVQKKLS